MHKGPQVITTFQSKKERSASDGIAELMRSGVVDNTRKTLNRGKTVA